VSSVEDRLRRLEDVEAIRTLDAVYRRPLDDGDRPALVQLSTPEGVLDGLRRVEERADVLARFAQLAEAGLTAFWHPVSNPEVAVDTDTATPRSLVWPGWRYRVTQVRFPYRAPLTDGWDAGRYELVGAVPPEVRA
jgi:SnoaL-like domain